MNYDLQRIVEIFEIDIHYYRDGDGKWIAEWWHPAPHFYAKARRGKGYGATKEAALLDLVHSLEGRGK